MSNKICNECDVIHDEENEIMSIVENGKPIRYDKTTE
jgi:hypothetical protein